VVVLNHIPSWPSVVVLYEPAADRSRVVFTGAGHQALLAAGDLDGDGRKELLFSGYSSVLRRLRVLSAVKVVPWIGTGVVVPGRETAASAELASGPGTNFVWQVLLGRRGIESLSLDDAAQADPTSARGRPALSAALRWQRSGEITCGYRDRASGPGGRLCESSRDAATSSLAEWKLGAAEAARAQAHALRAVDPRLAEISKRFQGMAQIRAGEVSRGLASLATLWETSEDASEIAYDAAEALHLSGHLESAVEWYRRSALQGGAMHLGKSKKDVLLSEVLALVELGRSAEARDRIVWYQTSYGWTNTEVSIATLRSYIDWRAGAAGSDLATFSAISSLGYGWEWSLLALEFRLSAGESPITLLPEVERLESLVTEGRGLFVLIRAELLHRLGRTSEAKIITAEAGRLLKPHQEVFEFALRDVAAERLKRLGVN
jgi:hypothetical protein